MPTSHFLSARDGARCTASPRITAQRLQAHAAVPETGGRRSSTQRGRTGQRLDIHLLNPVLVRFARAVPARDDAAVAEAPVGDDLPDTEARPAGDPPRHPAGYCRVFQRATSNEGAELRAGPQLVSTIMEASIGMKRIWRQGKALHTVRRRATAGWQASPWQRPSNGAWLAAPADCGQTYSLNSFR